jgi:uridine phosphorylase
MNAIIANRAQGTFSENPDKVIADLIIYTLDKMVC